MTFLSVRTGLSRVSAEYRRAFSFVPIMAGRFGIAPPGSKRASLAYRNLRRSGTRWLVSLFGIFFATFLMAVQGSLLYGFAKAASRIVDAIDADIWIVAKGTPAFEFVSSIPERYADIALGIEGVALTGRGVASWSPIQRFNGNRTLIFAVGVEEAFRGRIPRLSSLFAAAGLSDGGLLIDATDATLLGFSPSSGHVQVSGRRAHLFGTTTGFSSFLGAPLVLGTYQDIRRYLHYDRPEVAMMFARVAPGYNSAAVRDRLRARFADVDVWTADEMSIRSRIFWLMQTGAGASLSLAAILGFSIGLVLVAQTMYAITTENIEEFVTLRALGASDADIRSIVLTQSLICGFVGGSVGLAFVEPFTALARTSITWVVVPYWMYALIPLLILILCVCAAQIAARPALSADPERAFRA